MDTKKLKEVLTNAIKECVMKADTESMERIYNCVDWTWANPLDEDYIPLAREIRTTLHRLGTSALNHLIADIENGLITDGQQELSPYKISTGRLYFAIDWESGNEIIDRAVMICGIETEAARTMITDVRDDCYEIETYGEDTHNIEYYEWIEG